MPYRITALCGACDLCADECPTGAIQGAGVGSYAAKMIDPDMCVSCGDCAEVCPTGAIEEVDG